MPDFEGSVELFDSLVNELRSRVGPRAIEVRLDGAFFRREMLEFLQHKGLDFAVKVPFWRWLGVQAEIRKRRRWKCVGPDL